jgi:serine phosphatase RsbU (regulator of sigma subunit)
MARARGEGELRVRGMGLKRRFVLAMTGALSLVMLVAAALLYFGSTRVGEKAQQDLLAGAAKLTQRDPRVEARGAPLHHPSGVDILEVTYGVERDPATVYRAKSSVVTQDDFELLVPPPDDRGGNALLAIIVVVSLLVVLVGALVALWVAGKVTRPVESIIDDVRQISHGELSRRIRAEGGGEIELLARSIERMTRDLVDAQEARIELSVRERELSLAADVREALVPVGTPLIDGFDVAALHLSSAHIGGDFYDTIQLPDGRLGLLVCDVSGQGMPAALIGAIARSYLRSELEGLDEESGAESMAAALARVNRWLVSDVRRGVYVTAQYALIDPAAGQAIVASAGHKMPLLRIAAADGKLRTVHPEGIALGLDKGPVFERKLQTAIVPIEPGDRLVLCNSAPVRLVSPDGRELGEKAFYARALKHAGTDSHAFLKALRNDLQAFVGDQGIPYDVSLVTISRNP